MWCDVMWCVYMLDIVCVTLTVMMATGNRKSNVKLTSFPLSMSICDVQATSKQSGYLRNTKRKHIYLSYEMTRTIDIIVVIRMISNSSSNNTTTIIFIHIALPNRNVVKSVLDCGWKCWSLVLIAIFKLIGLLSVWFLFQMTSFSVFQH